MSRPGMIKRMLIGTLAAGALLGGVSAGLTPATADAGTRVTSGTRTVSAADRDAPRLWVCEITGDNVIFRDRNGTPLGQVHSGQKMDVYYRYPPTNQVGGYLWGDDRYVLVPRAYCS